MPTKIPYLDESWSPISGCSPISPGCKNCWAKRNANRLRGRAGYPLQKPFRPGVFHPDKLDAPTHWRVPRRVGVCFMGDLFHEAVPFRLVDRVFLSMLDAPRHTYLILTKRAQRMRKYVDSHAEVMGGAGLRWPWPMVWFGISAENDVTYRHRVRHLLGMGAAVRFISYEPALSPITLCPEFLHSKDGLPWVIIGAESGLTRQRRPMKLKWAASVVRQCVDAKVPVYVKQLCVSGVVSTDPRHWPEELRRQEYPNVDEEQEAK